MKSWLVRVVVVAAIGLSCGAAAQPPTSGPAAADPARPIPYKREEDLAGQLVRVGVGLAVALGVAFAALYGYKRYLGRHLAPTGRRMRVVESLRLTPKTTLFLVEVDGKTLLISQVGETLVALKGDVPAGMT